MVDKTGAEIIVDALEQEGVDVMFGYPGGCILDLCDTLNLSKKIKFILVRHEQGAAHAADGYARSTGKVGVCLATSGPGATNLVTGIATAYMDSIPMVAMTGQVATTMIGNDAFQEADIVGITRPITKHNYLVKDIKDLPRVFKEAFYIARTGRPGPVLIDIPKDIQRAVLKNYSYPDKVDIRSYKPVYEGHPNQIEKAAKAIEKAKKPLLYCGGGAIAADAGPEILALAEKCEIPVTLTLLGLGSFPADHPLALSMLGMHGTQYANYAMAETDLIIAVGARFDDRVTGKLDEFAPNAKGNIIHIDIDSSSISKSIAVSIPIVGNCKTVLQELIKIVKPLKHPEWAAQIKEWKEKFPIFYRDDHLLRPQYVIEQIYNVTKGDAIIVTEVGQHQMWAAHYFKYDKPRTFLSSGGLGTMGYGLPAAIGAQLSNPGKLVIDVAGDGSIQMNIQELATAVINKLPVKIVILNNAFLGMVRQWQELFYKRSYAFTDLQKNIGAPHKTADFIENRDLYIPDFVKLAEAYNVLGIRVTSKDDVAPALEKAFSSPQTAIVECIVEREENVFPMIPGGASIKQMIGGLA
ncbi:MAG TPA: biosynthetic-type acetolactate synthase large subunit [Candidatus Sumerlaeia bacterium]|mgnify:CR=1 FL=1|nr:biosynthetic-type acetolactate synthase large subunit [Candidatus Sumerlaeia bacterium]